MPEDQKSLTTTVGAAGVRQMAEGITIENHGAEPVAVRLSAEEMEEYAVRRWYVCDPEKNEACKKTSCSARGIKAGCTLTQQPEYAVRGKDGAPILAMERLEPISVERGSAEPVR